MGNNIGSGVKLRGHFGEFDVDAIPTMRKIKFAPRLLICLLASLCFTAHALAQAAPAAAPGLAPILNYIAAGWDNLTRSMTDCASVVDPKMKVNPVLYVPAGFAVPAAVDKLHADCQVEIEHLPKTIHQLGEIDTSTFHPHGLLYLPNKYVVPGGRFNEMYGWDSYFIVRGLLRAGRVELARGMVDNFFFDIEHYGA
ncbi:MAG TPA: trehalase family glycosidase, partial [Bryobacteraceae bacterium]|nr:trehalase family glycosidase [Bryobacteraceae bacterium]